MSAARRGVSPRSAAAPPASHGANSVRLRQESARLTVERLRPPERLGVLLLIERLGQLRGRNGEVAQAGRPNRKGVDGGSQESHDRLQGLTGPTCPASTRTVSRSPASAPAGNTGRAGNSSRPLRSTLTCPIRLPLSTVET